MVWRQCVGLQLDLSWAWPQVVRSAKAQWCGRWLVVMSGAQASALKPMLQGDLFHDLDWL